MAKRRSWYWKQDRFFGREKTNNNNNNDVDVDDSLSKMQIICYLEALLEAIGIVIRSANCSGSPRITICIWFNNNISFDCIHNSTKHQSHTLQCILCLLTLTMVFYGLLWASSINFAQRIPQWRVGRPMRKEGSPALAKV